MASGGTTPVAIIGAVTGGASLAWNVFRAARERERLYVSLNVFQEDMPEHKGPVAMLAIVNHGKFPAHIVNAGISDEPKIPWSWRWPFKAMSFKTRNRALFGLLRKALGQPTMRFLPLDIPEKVLPPRELFSYKVERSDADIESWLRERRWLNVHSSIRNYVVRLVDSRKQIPAKYQRQ